MVPAAAVAVRKQNFGRGRNDEGASLLPGVTGKGGLAVAGEKGHRAAHERGRPQRTTHAALEPEPAVAGPRGVGVKGRGKFGGLDKVCRLLGTAVADHGKPYAGGIEAVFYGGQSSSLLPAEQSTEVAYETQHHGTLGPERG